MKLWKVKLNQFHQPYGFIVFFSTAKVARKEFWFTRDIILLAAYIFFFSPYSQLHSPS